MVNKYQLFVMFVLLFLFSVSSAEENRYSFVRISFDTSAEQQLAQIQKLGVDITFFNGRKGLLEAIISNEQQDALTKLGFTVTPIIRDYGAYVEQLQEQDYFKPFHNYDEMLAEMQQIVANHPDIASLHDIGDSYNKVQGDGGYDIWAIKISDDVAVDDSTEADALFMSNIHAREIITPEVTMYFMHYLIDNYGTDPYVTHLVNNREIWIIPTVNPDGHEYVFTGHIEAGIGYNTSDPIWWRKNMEDNNNTGAFEYGFDGVDLNRNFGFKWGYNNSGSSPRADDPTYRGKSAFSEPESQVIRDFVAKHHFVVSLSYHSYGKMWLYPWAYAKKNPPEPDGSAFVALGDSCVAYNGYEAGNYFTGTIYEVNGDTDDWLYGEKGVFAFSPEVGGGGRGFFPDTTMIMPLVLENLGPNLYMAYAAGEEPIVKHEPLPDFDRPQESYTVNATIIKPILLTEPVALDESSFKVFYKNSVDAPFDSLHLQPAGVQDKYTADIPGDSSDGVIYYYVQASDDSGRTGTSPRGAPAAVDSFQIVPDSVPPEIAYQPVEFTPLSDSLVISAKVTDKVGVAKVTLHVNYNRQEYQIPMTADGDDTFTARLDTLGLSEGDSLQYRIFAVDGSQNKNTSVAPESGWYFLGIYKSILSYDFEDDSTLTAKPGSDWEWGKPSSGPDSAHSGQKLWATRLSGNYSNSSNSTLDVPPMELVGGIENVAFSFWHWYSTEFSRGSIWDGGNVKLSVVGVPFNVIAPESGYDGVIDNYNPVLGGEPGFGGPPDGTPGWREEIFDLSQYIGHTVQIRFQFGSDDNTTAPGWYIDDLGFLVFPTIDTKVSQTPVSLPGRFQLRQNYPNPFNSETFIRFELPEKQHVRLSVYNSLGQIIKVLVEQNKSAGRYVVKWDGKNRAGVPVVSGLYFYRMETKDMDVVRKMLYLR